MKYRNLLLAFPLFLVSALAIIVFVAKPGNDLACSMFGYLNSKLVSSNEIEVSPSIKDGLSIEWQDFSKDIWVNVFENGQETNEIPSTHGLNIFRVSAQGGEKLSFQQIKTNNWYMHKYQFSGATGNISLQIEGCDNVSTLPDA